MSVFFGTDGLRGVALSEITFDVAYKCGNSLSQMSNKKLNVVLGRDTRISGDMIALAVSSGLLAGGSDVTYVGTVPTGAVAYLASQGFDYGIMITASHNTSEYNGIKIFSSKGEKLSDKEEELIERGFIRNKTAQPCEAGNWVYKPALVNTYKDFICSTSSKLYGMRVVLDCSNGATYKCAPAVFKALGAKVYCSSCKNDGRNINNNCGSLHTKNLAKKVVKYNADFGFAFDGDGDRLIAIDEKGNEIDGDKVLTALATSFKERKMLPSNKVVGTSQTNMGIEKTLEKRGILLERADVGDKYVLEKMKKNNLELGGEQSGHIIIRKYMKTGDGILTAVQLANCALIQNKQASEITYAEKYPQFNINIPVKDKLRTLGSEVLANAILVVQQELAGSGRVLVRASGTEPKIRIMVESEDYEVSKNLAEYLKNVVLEITKEDSCVE